MLSGGLARTRVLMGHAVALVAVRYVGSARTALRPALALLHTCTMAMIAAEMTMLATSDSS